MAAEELLTPAEAALRIGVHPRTLKRWAIDGKVRHVRRPSGRYLFPASVVEDVHAIHEPDGPEAA